MTTDIQLDRILAACSDDSADAAIRIQTSLEPIGGPGAPVKPAVYDGGRYQQDKRWESVEAEAPTDVIVIDNVPSQANRLEAAIQQHVAGSGLPELVLDLGAVAGLPAHLPRSLSSWQFPHRNADAYLRDAELDGVAFPNTELGEAIFAATPWSAAALVSWFPQALLYGFWQSHLGKKRANTKHARAWVSEILGWRPASTDTKVLGLKGDPLNLNTDETVTSNPDDRQDWGLGKAKVEGGKADKLSEMGHGQVPFMREGDAAPAGVSFARVTQSATLSFAQLRRVSLGDGANPEADAAARALIVALGLFGHVHAFGRGFALRSGADLQPMTTDVSWLGSSLEEVALPSLSGSGALLEAARANAQACGVALDGWGQPALVLTPRENLGAAIRATWPIEDA